MHVNNILWDKIQYSTVDLTTANTRTTYEYFQTVMSFTSNLNDNKMLFYDYAKITKQSVCKVKTDFKLNGNGDNIGREACIC